MNKILRERKGKNKECVILNFDVVQVYYCYYYSAQLFHCHTEISLVTDIKICTVRLPGLFHAYWSKVAAPI